MGQEGNVKREIITRLLCSITKIKQEKKKKMFVIYLNEQCIHQILKLRYLFQPIYTVLPL